AFAVGFQTGATISIDTEGAGIPDWWRQKYFGHPDAQAGDLSRVGDDADGDGRTNLEEYILGTNPTVKDFTTLPVRVSKNAQGQATLTFSTRADRVYRVFYRDDLAGGSWLQAGGDIAGSGVTMT